MLKWINKDLIFKYRLHTQTLDSVTHTGITSSTSEPDIMEHELQ